MNKEIIGYYQSNIKTSRKEDSVYAMKYASQQMLINKLQQENKKLHNKIDILIGILKTWKDFCEVKQKYCIEKDKEYWTYCIEKLECLEAVLKESDVDECE